MLPMLQNEKHTRLLDDNWLDLDSYHSSNKLHFNVYVLSDLNSSHVSNISALWWTE